MSERTMIYNLPAELDADEPEIVIAYYLEPPEAETRDYPGSPGGVEIVSITRVEDGVEYDLEKMFRDLLADFEAVVWDHANEEEQGAREYAEEERYQSWKEQQHGEEESQWLKRISK